jgi:hypothetical protein
VGMRAVPSIQSLLVAPPWPRVYVNLCRPAYAAGKHARGGAARWIYATAAQDARRAGLGSAALELRHQLSSPGRPGAILDGAAGRMCARRHRSRQADRVHICRRACVPRTPPRVIDIRRICMHVKVRGQSGNTVVSYGSKTPRRPNAA